MNEIERIIAKHSNVDVVKPGEIVEVDVDLVMTNDGTTAHNIDIFENELGCEKVWDNEKLSDDNGPLYSKQYNCSGKLP